MILGEVKAALDIIEKISGWITRITSYKDAEEMQSDAQIVAETGKLLIALRALDNAIHSLLGQLTLFDADWSQEQRVRLISEINQFAHREEIIRIIRESLRQLQVLASKANELDRTHLNTVSGCAAELLRAMSDSPVTPFPDVDALREFAMRIKKAQDQQDVQTVINESSKVLSVLDRKRLASADEAYGRLKGQILLRHPNMPKPDWVV